LRKPHNFGNPGGFDFVRWLALQEIYVTGYVSRQQSLIRLGMPESRSWLRKIDAFRSAVRERIDSTTSPPANSFLRGLLLGEQSAIPDEVKENFIRTGTAHVIAISGLNIGIVAAFSIFFSEDFWGFRIPSFKNQCSQTRGSFISFPVAFYTLLPEPGYRSNERSS
jgi:competence protein ComEC